MDEMQPNIWSARSGRLSGTTGRRGLLWVLRTQGFHTKTYKGIWAVGQLKRSWCHQTERTSFSAETHCHHVPKRPFYFVEEHLRAKEQLYASFSFFSQEFEGDLTSCLVVLGKPETKNGDDVVSEVLYRSLVPIMIAVNSGAAEKRGVLFLAGLFLCLLRAGWQFE